MPTLICHGVLNAADSHIVARVAPAASNGRLVLVMAAGLAAVATELPTSTLLEAMMATTEGVTTLAVEHNRILTELSLHADVVPFRLDCFHSGEPSILAMIQRERPRLEAALLRIESCAEFGIKLEIGPGRPGPVEAADTATAAAQTGRDYLLARLANRDRAAKSRSQSARFVDALMGSLAGLCEQTRLRPVPTEARGRVILSAALLLKRMRRKDFAELIDAFSDDLERSGYRLVATGPWPPYHFCDTTDE